MSDDRPAAHAANRPTIVLTRGANSPLEARWKGIPAPETLVGRGETFEGTIGDLITENPDIVGINIEFHDADGAQMDWKRPDEGGADD